MSQTKERSQMLGKAPVSSVITKLAIPAIIGMLINAVYNFVDTMFVSWIGTEAMSAAQIGFPVFMILTAVGQLYGIGGSSYLSRLMGEKKMVDSHKTATVVYFTSFATGLLLCISGIFILDPLLNLFGATPDTLDLAQSYARILFVGAPFIIGNMALNNMLRAEGSAVTSMFGLILGAVINIILDPIFIFSFDMGIGGAALATILAQAITSIFLLSYYLRRKTVVQIHRKFFKPSRQIYTEIFKIGLPTLIRQLLASFAIGIMNNAAAQYGTEAVAAIGIVSKIFMLGFYALIGYSQGFLPVAGFNYGAKKYNRVLEAIKVGIRVSTIYCLATFAVFMIFAGPILTIFKPAPEVATLAKQGIRIWALSMPVLGYSIIVNMLFQAIGKGKEAGLLSISRQGILLIPLLLILPKAFGLYGVMFAQPIADLLTFFITLFFDRKVRQELKQDACLTDGEIHGLMEVAN